MWKIRYPIIPLFHTHKINSKQNDLWSKFKFKTCYLVIWFSAPHINHVSLLRKKKESKIRFLDFLSIPYRDGIYDSKVSLKKLLWKYPNCFGRMSNRSEQIGFYWYKCEIWKLKLLVTYERFGSWLFKFYLHKSWHYSLCTYLMWFYQAAVVFFEHSHEHALLEVFFNTNCDILIKLNCIKSIRNTGVSFDYDYPDYL